MTEQAWLAATNPFELNNVKPSHSGRKRRLLACAFARRVLFLLPEVVYRLAIETNERFADGLVEWKEVELARKVITKTRQINQEEESVEQAVRAVWTSLDETALVAFLAWDHAAAARGALTRPNFDRGPDFDRGYEEEQREAMSLIRDVFGNPFRPVSIEPEWLVWKNGTVVNLAQAIYDDRRFENMSILADALMDAGCNNDEILNHCRWEGPHVRGCWVVDLLLNKE